MRIVLGVAGGIAAYKVAEVASRLVQAGHEVETVMSEAATQFVGPLTFAALTGRPVGLSAADGPRGPLSHVALARWADAMIVAPATADRIARMVAGTADDMLSLVYLGFRGPCIVAPAMEPHMWDHPAIQRNVQRLTADGVVWVGPVYGRTASGMEGNGRMAEPEDIVNAVDDLTVNKDLAGRVILVTAGPTWEHFDPVRILTNPSTGTMGLALAREALRRGATVSLLVGPGVELSAGWIRRVEVVRIVSAEELLEALLERAANADALIATAAVSDFRPKQRSSLKQHKANVGLLWEMKRNPDTLQEFCRVKDGHTVVVGFAAETHAQVESAARKLREKGLDWVVANTVGPAQGFSDLPYQGMIIGPNGPEESVTSKPETASKVLDRVARRLSTQTEES